MTIFVAGCSHVFGHGFPDCEAFGDMGKPSKYAWPQKASADGYDIVNVSEPGGGPQAMLESLDCYDDKQDLTHLFLMVPLSQRYLLKNHWKGRENFCIGKLDGYKESGKWGKTLLHWMKDIKYPEHERHLMLGTIGYYQSVANNNNAKLWLGFTDEDDYLDIEDSNFEVQTYTHNGESKPFIWQTFAHDVGAGYLPDMHFDEVAHDAFYQLQFLPFVK